MRTLVVGIFLIIGSSASADTALRPVVDLGAVEASCRPLAHSTPDRASKLDAYVSVANCNALVRGRRLVLPPSPALRDALEHAVRPSLALLDDVIASGDLAHQIIAERAKADIYQGIAVRLASMVPPRWSMTSDVDHQKRVLYADALARTWRQRATDARREVARLAGEDPELVATNAMIARAVQP